MRHSVRGILLVGLLALSACGSLASAPATPETWTPPPATVTVVPTSTPEPTRPALATYTVQRGVIEQRADLQGRVVAVGERELSFVLDGVVQEVYVTSDTDVARGQVLAELAPGELGDQLIQAEQQLAEVQRRQDLALGELRFPLRRAEIELESARAELARLLAPPDAIRVATARAALQQAEAARDRARNDASAAKNRAELALKEAETALRVAQAEYGAAAQAAEADKDNNSAQERLARAGDALRAAEREVARLQIDFETARGNEVAAVQAAEAQVSLAQVTLNELLRGPSAAEIAEARRALALAELAVDEARSRVQVDPELDRLLREAKQNVADVQRQIDELRLVASFDGRVQMVNITPGSLVRAGEAAMIVLDPAVDATQMEILVPNSGAAALVAGQPVTIAFARYPGMTYQGTVAKMPTDLQSASLSLSAYHVTYEPADLQLDSGDTAVVTAVMARREAVLWLPPKAIRADSTSYVLVQRGDRPERVDIVTGITTADQVEIVSGLNEGDVVISQ